MLISIKHKVSKDAKPFQPSNGMEGELMHEVFCARCEHCDKCNIMSNTMFYNIDDPEYPKEWLIDDVGPTCTKFKELKL